MRAIRSYYFCLMFALALLVSAVETSFARAQFFTEQFTVVCLNGHQTLVNAPNYLPRHHKFLFPCADCLGAFVGIAIAPAPYLMRPTTAARQISFESSSQAISHSLSWANTRGPPLTIF
jgi:hypothetical protein